MASQVIAILLTHWLADFVFQTKWMAENKSKSIWPLTFHCVVYGLILFLGTFTFASAQWVLINTVLHFSIDALTSKLNAYFWERGNSRAFFISVGFDQFLHSFFLISTMGI